MQLASDSLAIDVQTRMELDAALNQAVDVLKPAAMTEQVGISVTRLVPGRYEAGLNSNVPPGVIIERWGASCDERASERSLRHADQQRI
jgi:hypothetical protein